MPVGASLVTGPRFGKIPNATFVIPEKQIILDVAGMGGPKSSVVPLTDYFTRKGHKAHAVQVPGIAAARNTIPSTVWLINRIDNARIPVAQGNIATLWLKIWGQDSKTQMAILQKELGLDSSRKATKTALAVANLLGDKSFRSAIQQLNGAYPFTDKLKPDDQRLALLLKDARERLDADLKISIPDVQMRQKTVNHVLDRLAPRVTLVGHSLGGFVSSHAILNPDESVGLTIALGSPVSGTDPVPDSLGWIEKMFLPRLREPLKPHVRGGVGQVFPAVHQMNAGSKSVNRLQNADLPFDTTAISVANPNDGLVKPHNAQFNEDKPGYLNIVVKPLKASIETLMEPFQQLALKMAKLNPLVKLSQVIMHRTPAWEGLAHHCGLVDNHNEYWPQQGDMLNQVLNGPQAHERMRKLLAPQNYEPVRVRLLELIIDDVQAHPFRAAHYKPLEADLKAVAAEKLPFEQNAARQASQLLQLL